jgi:hypothetical protein
LRLDPKIAVLGLVAAVLLGLTAFGAGTARADVHRVTQVATDEAINTFTTNDECKSQAATPTPNPNNEGQPGTSVFRVLANGDVVVLGTGQSTWFCIDAVDGDGDVTVDSNDYGVWDRCLENALQGDPFVNDPCRQVTGLATDQLIVQDSGTNLDLILVRFTCQSTAGNALVTIHQGDQANTPYIQFTIQCRGAAGGITLTARPTTVEIVPAPSNTAHSLLWADATDSSGNPIPIAQTDVDFFVNSGPLLGTGPLGYCNIESNNVNDAGELGAAFLSNLSLTTSQPSTYLAWDTFANTGVVFDSSPALESVAMFDYTSGGVLRSRAAAILHCDVHALLPSPKPGIVTVTACINVVSGDDICKSVEITVIGPPASVTVAASPTSVRCGEKSTITVTVKDAVGQNVSDHTAVELVSNLGGTIGGTGAVAGFAGPVVPISSSVAGTFGGVATAFLLTSETHTGPYEVVATTGGTDPVSFGGWYYWDGRSDLQSVRQTTLGGIFSTPPVSAEVTVTCSLPQPTTAPAATVTAPKTGTGVLPPNTGDAGLKDSSSSWTLFALGGLAAFALAGLATLKFARR